jgi:hypothetical protein
MSVAISHNSASSNLSNHHRLDSSSGRSMWPSPARHHRHRPAPRLEGVPAESWLPEPAVPVTAGLFRLFSLESIVAQAIAQLRAGEHRQKVAERLGKARAMGNRELDAYRRLRRARTPSARPSEREIELIARRYIQLVGRGIRHPLPQIADELGLSREQVRDRIHRARQPALGYLQPAKPGRVSAEPGPRLKGPGNA